MTLHQFFRDVYKPLRLLGKSQRTVTLYEYSIRLYSRTLGRDATLDDFNDIAISKHLQVLIDEGRSPHGVNKERSQLVAMWNFAAKKRMVEEFPTVPILLAPVETPQAWTRDQLSALFDCCKKQRGKICGLDTAAWWFAIHCVLWDSGERIGAILKVRWSDLEIDWLKIRASYRKGKRRDQIVRLHEKTVEALDPLRRDDGLIFPWDKSETYLYRVYNRILKQAGLPTDKCSKFHRMRKSFASHLHAIGGDATAGCGHSSDAVTRKSYLDPRIAAKEQPCDLLFRPA